MVLIRYWRSLTKKDSVKSATYKIYNFFYFYSCFRTFFHRFGSGFFPIVSGFLADPYSDSRKKSDPDPGKKTGSKRLN